MYITELIIAHKKLHGEISQFSTAIMETVQSLWKLLQQRQKLAFPSRGQRWKVPQCSVQALTKNLAKAAMEGPHKHFFTSVNTDLSLFAASTSSGDATATTTPLSLTVSTASANSLKSLRLSCGSQHCQCDLC
jgi:hypothetical protein